jgi:hypothetical protein
LAGQSCAGLQDLGHVGAAPQAQAKRQAPHETVIDELTRLALLCWAYRRFRGPLTTRPVIARQILQVAGGQAGRSSLDLAVFRSGTLLATPDLTHPGRDCSIE